MVGFVPYCKQPLGQKNSEAVRIIAPTEGQDSIIVYNCKIKRVGIHPLMLQAQLFPEAKRMFPGKFPETTRIILAGCSSLLELVFV